MVAHYNVDPITDKDKIAQLFAGDSTSFGLYTECEGKPAPYCIPGMYYVCYHCGLISNNYRKICPHVDDCQDNESEHTSNELKTNKHYEYIHLGLTTHMIASMNSKPRFGWHKGQRYLVIKTDKDWYAYSCFCGKAFNSIRALCEHFDRCSSIKKHYETKVSNSEDVNKTSTALIKGDIRGGQEPAEKTCPIRKYNHFESGFVENNGNKFTFCYSVPDKNVLQGIRKKDGSYNDKKQYKILNYCRTIDLILNENWQEICNLVENGSANTNWGARKIQSGRIEIGVTSEYVQDLHTEGGWKMRGNECWKEIERTYKLTAKWMKDVIQYAKQTSDMDNKREGKTMKYGSFSLILTKNSGKQEKHLDLATPLAQFALILSNNVDSTIAYRVTSREKVNSMDKFCELLRAGGVCKKWNTVGKAEELINLINKIDPISRVGKMISHQGYGQLFQTMIPPDASLKAIEWQKYFHYESAHLSNAPTLTYTRINGSVIHSGSGILNNCVRCILFWSGSPQEYNEMYDPDVQETSMSVMIEIIREVWFDRADLREQMVEFMFNVQKTCNDGYKKEGQSYGTETEIEEMLKHFNQITTSTSKTNILKMIKRVANKQLFAEPK